MIKCTRNEATLCCSDHACCPEQHHLCGRPEHHRCYNESQGEEEADCSCRIVEYKTGGIVSTGYKELCHHNMIWLEWRHKCVRRN